MYQGSESDRIKRQAISQYKAQHVQDMKLDWFVESCPQQALEIAEYSGAWVICTANGEVY